MLSGIGVLDPIQALPGRAGGAGQANPKENRAMARKLSARPQGILDALTSSEVMTKVQSDKSNTFAGLNGRSTVSVSVTTEVTVGITTVLNNTIFTIRRIEVLPVLPHRRGRTDSSLPLICTWRSPIGSFRNS